MSELNAAAVCKFSCPELHALMAEFKQTGSSQNSLKRYQFKPENCFNTNSDDWLYAAVQRMLLEMVPFQRAFEHGHILRIPIFKIAICSVTVLSDCLLLLYQLMLKTKQHPANQHQDTQSNPHAYYQPLCYFIEWTILNRNGKAIASMSTLDILKDPKRLGSACMELMLSDFDDFFQQTGPEVELLCVWPNSQFLHDYLHGALATLNQVDRNYLIKHIFIAEHDQDLHLVPPDYQRLSYLYQRYRDQKVRERANQ